MVGVKIRDTRGNTIWVCDVPSYKDNRVRSAVEDALYNNIPLRNADLENAELQGSNLCYADLRGSRLRGANLKGVNLKKADLTEADIRCANLRYANLKSSVLYKADLTSADLRDTNLQDASLQGAQLEEADLRGANLTDVYLANIQLRHTRIRGVHMCVKQAAYIMPDLYLLKMQDPTLKLKAWKYLAQDYGSPIYDGPERIIYEIGGVYKAPRIEGDALLECAAGLHVAPLSWCIREACDPRAVFAEVEFEIKDIVAIPFFTDGKFRVKKLKVLRIIDKEDARELLLKSTNWTRYFRLEDEL